MMHRIVRFLRPGAALVALVACSLSACSSSQSSARPVSKNPPRAVAQFCDRPVQRQLSTSLGVAPERVTTPRTPDHAYSCRYVYANGAISLSVERFTSASAATAHTVQVARQRGRRPEPPQLGDGFSAFMTTDGSVVVRKDRDVLDVDVASLPDRFGNPPQASSVIARAVATTIVGHWSPG